MKAATPTRLLAFALAAALLGGCAAVRAHKGAVLDQQISGAIQPGVDNKASVTKLLGRPSFTGQFTPNDWYYISRDTRQFAFSNPKVVRTDILLIRFDAAGNVTQVRRNGKEMLFALNPSDRSTPTLGRKRSLIEELFGNVGAVGSSTTSQ